jgi:hypothetical protein
MMRVSPSHRCAPIAPTARAVQLVNLAPPETARWHVVARNVPVCILELTIELGNRGRGGYRIFDPSISEADKEAGFLTPPFRGAGSFERSSPWWTKDVLRDVLRAIVRECIAPAAADITIAYEGLGGGGAED